jgi:hypothetical protein
LALCLVSEIRFAGSLRSPEKLRNESLRQSEPRLVEIDLDDNELPVARHSSFVTRA